MACAVCGAWKGIDAIPQDMIETLRRANPDYNFDDIAASLTVIAQRNQS
jgi:ADP-ribosylglycohydrolase